MIDELGYPQSHIEELESEIKALQQGNKELSEELKAVYGSRSYRVGRLAGTSLRDPKSTIKRVAKLTKNTGRLSPKALKYRRSITPHNSAIFNTDYRKWQKDFEPGEKELSAQRANVKTFQKKPVFSIITPVFKPPQDVLVELIESVLEQTYPNFELCLGEFSGDEATRSLLKEYASKDERIKTKFFDSNDGISENSNLCYELATGDYIALLDHDDTLSPNALYENALLINEDDYDFIYSDKDKIDEQGNRFDPMFKPDWSPEIMLTANYLTHLNVFKSSLVKKIGGWDKSTDGAQDWDLFFRLIEVSSKVGHIPKILYHWRVLETSTAFSITTKPYALEGQRKAIAKHISSLGIEQPTVSHAKNGALSLNWGPFASKNKSVHCVIYADSETLGAAYRLIKVLVKTKRITKDDITIYRTDNLNQNLSEIISKLRIENDVMLFIDAKAKSTNRPEWLDEMLGWLSVPEVGIVSPQIFSKHGVYLGSGRVVGLGSSATPLFAGETYMPGVFGYREWSRNSLMPNFSCFAVKTDAIKDKKITQSGVQGLREIALQSIANGFRTVIEPYNSVILDTTALYEPAMSDTNQQLIRDIIPDYIDPFFSQNLSVASMNITFITKAEVEKRKSVIESYMDQPIEYDPTADTSHKSYATEPLPLVGQRRDAYILSSITDYSPQEIINSRRITDNHKSIQHIESALWIVPNFTTLYAGLKNIFALASEMTNKESTQHTFYIATQEDATLVRDLVVAVYPNLEKAIFVNSEEYLRIKESERFTIGVCTLWTTAYELLKNNNVGKKLYIIQDDERTFYLRGTLYGLVDNTYRFGFIGIAGTKALSDWYQKEYNGDSVVLGSDLELTEYLKQSEDKPSKIQPDKIPSVLFYARPDAPRNGFELGVKALDILAEKLKGKVRIVLAGADFDIAQYSDLHPSIHVAGKVSYQDLPKFYAGFDVALFLMFSEHPGVFPLEMMASSCPIVVNKHNNESWDELYIDGKTCLTADPTPSILADTLHRALDDSKLRKTLIDNGRSLARQYSHDSYLGQVTKTINFVKKGKQ